MFTLIKREIEDNIAYFLAAVVFTTILAAMAIAAYYEDFQGRSIERFQIISSWVIIIGCLAGACVMGVTQMRGDRNKKVSSFLATLAVTRSRLLTARIIAGILAILTLLLPMAIINGVFMSRNLSYIPNITGMLVKVFAILLLLSFACYCLGLQIGWSSSRIAALAALLLAGVLIWLVVIKGFGTETIVILGMFIAASLLRISQKFISTPL
ncbi:MAG: hypothetical protein ABIG61_06485 [Planctomycetota bacterium]